MLRRRMRMDVKKGDNIKRMNYGDVSILAPIDF
jgi:hypothetical protein